MTGTIRRMRAAVFAGCVGAALAFGATAARADAGAAGSCSDPLANGTCTTHAGCTASCLPEKGDTGTCMNSCCYCLWL